MREEIKHATLLAASLLLLAIALTRPHLLLPALLASLAALALSPPHFSHPYPQSYVKYDYVYRKYVLRPLAVAYVLAAIILHPSLATLSLTVLVAVYSIASLLIGVKALAIALLSLVATSGLVALHELTLRPLTLTNLAVCIAVALCLVAAPLFFAAYYALADRVKLPLALGGYMACTLLFAGFAVAGVAASLLETPFFLIPTAFAVAGAAAFLLSAIKTLGGEIWSYTNYHSDFVDKASQLLLNMLSETRWSYRVKSLLFRRGVRLRVKEPFKAEIVVREWPHRAYIPAGGLRIPVKVSSGTIITVSPAPSKAPKELRTFIAEFLRRLELDWEASQWGA